MKPSVPGFPRRFPVRSDDRRPLRYRLVAGLARLVLGTYYWRLIRWEGLENIAPGGRLIVACNHLSNLDPVLFGGFYPRTLFAMAKKELFPNRLTAWIWAGCNTFPVDRGTADRWALSTAVGVVRDGGRLLLFVEGTRATSPGMKRAEPGVGFLLRRAAAGDVPAPSVQPVAIWGTEKALVKGRRMLRRVPIRIRVGPVFTPQLGQGAARDDQGVADQVAARIAALLPPEYRGHYATPAGA